MANIVSLTVENFRSYKNKTVFTFEAVDEPQMDGNYHEVLLKSGKIIRLLNTAVIYGANAAGKSNVIIALSAISSFVKFSKRYDPDDSIVYDPYMFSPNTRNAPIRFWIDFIVDGVEYEYRFAYTREAFVSETLKMHGKLDYIFDRNEDGSTDINHNYLPDIPNDFYLTNHLALSELSLKADPLIQSIYRELSSMRVFQLTDVYGRVNNMEGIVRLLREDEGDNLFAKTLKNLISSADTGINDIVLKEQGDDNYYITPNGERFKMPQRYEINLMHPSEGGEDMPLVLERESAGTQTLFKAGARVIQTLERGGFLAYDEMNIALHPMLFRRLVELFNNKKTNPKNAQLLVTTHDTVLIDDVLLRADQIWFAEKEKGVSNLYSAIDFDGVMIDQPFGPWYRAGRLGGNPRLTVFVPTYSDQPSKIDE